MKDIGNKFVGFLAICIFLYPFALAASWLAHHG